ncbi:unnamed protein product [Anisakis simplex]|uniref:Putative glycerol kinase 5 (inferred by orthology to a human protein) n=1 Tax=Anisakis simplex TaxID=6269 RepID=A0A0M3KG04_ANISI|nr:unnamed protein product [Anisakis simplex]
MNIFGSVAHFFTRIQRFKAFRMFQFLGGFVTHRLMVTIQENAEMQNLLTSDKLMYGCLDTWLIHKLTKGAVHVTEPSNSSTTGLYDPYMMNWGHMLLRIISFPVSLLPKLTFSAGVPLATCHNEIFGFPLKIGSMAGDQQAALFGSGGWHKGDVNICIGTGAFLDLNTGQHPIASLNGLYPVLAWRFPHHYNFAAEGSSFETGSLVKWAQSIGLFDDIAQLPNITSKVSRTDLCFVPAFSGLQTPINDTTACCAFLGLRPNTTKEHMLIALLDSIAFRIYQIWNTLTDEIDFEVNNVIK